MKESESSFVSTTSLQFGNFINKLCVCYLKQCEEIKSVRGTISGVAKIAEEYLIQYSDDEGRTFHIPFSNIGLFEEISKELNDKLKKQYEEQKQKIETQAEQSIKDEINLRMEEVQNQKEQLNANESKSGESPERQEEGDSDFVLQL